jgi:hypothetical protein
MEPSFLMCVSVNWWEVLQIGIRLSLENKQAYFIKISKKYFRDFLGAAVPIAPDL